MWFMFFMSTVDSFVRYRFTAWRASREDGNEMQSNSNTAVTANRFMRDLPILNYRSDCDPDVYFFFFVFPVTSNCSLLPTSSSSLSRQLTRPQSRPVYFSRGIDAISEFVLGSMKCTETLRR